MEQACWTGEQVLNDMKLLICLSDAGVDREAANFSLNFLNQSSEVKEPSLMEMLSSNTEFRNETSKGGVKRDFKIGVDSSNIAGSSSC